MLYIERNIVLVSHFALKMLARAAVLARQSPLHGKYSARLAGQRDGGIPASRAEIFPCNRKLIFSGFNRRAESPANRAGPTLSRKTFVFFHD